MRIEMYFEILRSSSDHDTNEVSMMMNESLLVMFMGEKL